MAKIQIVLEKRDSKIDFFAGATWFVLPAALDCLERASLIGTPFTIAHFTAVQRLKGMNAAVHGEQLKI
jgi:hypothetical protein